MALVLVQEIVVVLLHSDYIRVIIAQMHALLITALDHLLICIARFGGKSICFIGVLQTDLVLAKVDVCVS